MILFLVLFTLGFELLLCDQTEFGLHSEQVVLVGIFLGLFTLGTGTFHHVAHLFLLGFPQVLLFLLSFIVCAHCNAPFFDVLALFHFAGPETLDVLLLIVKRLAHVTVNFEQVECTEVLVSVSHQLGSALGKRGIGRGLLELEIGRWRCEI